MKEGREGTTEDNDYLVRVKGKHKQLLRQPSAIEVEMGREGREGRRGLMGEGETSGDIYDELEQVKERWKGETSVGRCDFAEIRQ